jgi:hypothetical protein
MGKTSAAHGSRGATEAGERKKKRVVTVVVVKEVTVTVLVLVMGMRTSRGDERRLI